VSKNKSNWKTRLTNDSHLRPDNCTFDEYQVWFQRECNAIPLKPGCSAIGPQYTAVNDPDPPWTIILAILYSDGMYVRIYEHYRELSQGEGGGGRLQWLSYHYGRCSDERDDDGFPNKEDDCTLRIDIDHRNKEHAHYDGENHIPAHRLVGLDFETITPFDFIGAVERHRTTHRPLPEILEFEVRPAE
jgi:hypothetical protein